MKFIVLHLLVLSPILSLAGQDFSPNSDNKIKMMVESFEKKQATIRAESAEVKNSNEAHIKANLNLFRELKEPQTHLNFLQAENEQLRSTLAQTSPPINLNTATLDELTVDDRMADKIISNRPYSSIEKATLPPHFDPVKLKEIATLITVE